MYCRSWSRVDPLFDQLHGPLKPGITRRILRSASVAIYLTEPTTCQGPSSKPHVWQCPLVRGPNDLLSLAMAVVSSATVILSLCRLTWAALAVANSTLRFSMSARVLGALAAFSSCQRGLP